MAGRRLTEAPPSRWRVVERGRRLDVIDTATGLRVAAPTDPEPAPRDPARAWRGLSLPRRTRFDGSGEWTTHRWYDANGPRTIRLDAVDAARIGRVQVGLVVAAIVAVIAVIAWPWLLIGLALPLQAAVREPARKAITRWLDGLAREGR